MTATQTLLAWSGGKDCLLALQRLRADPQWHVVGLLTTINRNYERVAMHGIHRGILLAQTAALGLPLVEVLLDWPGSNEAYEEAHSKGLAEARMRWPGVRHCAFGDLFLQDVRDYRVRQLGVDNWRAVFPLWGENTTALSRRFVSEGHRAVLCCVDTQQLDASYCGRDFDTALLDQLPAGVDPCGERGEFHTMTYGGPLFRQPLRLRVVNRCCATGAFNSPIFCWNKREPIGRRTMRGDENHVLPDVLQPGLTLVFCGTAAGRRSAADRAYYAHPGNLFWRALHQSGLTPRQLVPAEFPQLPGYGIGLTDLAKHHFGNDAELPRDAFDVAALTAKILRHAPRFLAFTSKNGARAALGHAVEYGQQAKLIGDTQVFVLPSPSGQARGHWSLAPWLDMARATGLATNIAWHPGNVHRPVNQN